MLLATLIGRTFLFLFCFVELLFYGTLHEDFVSSENEVKNTAIKIQSGKSTKLSTKRYRLSGSYKNCIIKSLNTMKIIYNE